MPIYWTFLIASLVIWGISAFHHKHVMINGFVETRDYAVYAVIFGALLIFFCGLRSGVADTETYINIFDAAASDFSAFQWSEAGKGPAFSLGIVLYKSLVSSDFHGWLFLIAVICVIPVMRTLIKYSCSFGFSCFLFISTTIFTYLVNGMRQFICVAIIFACIQLIEEKKFFQYLIVILLLSTIHSSALMLIPFYFITKIRPWTMGTWFMIAGGLTFGYFFDRFRPMVEMFLENTEYENYIEVLSSGTGSNLYRLAIAAVPVVLSLIGRRYLWEADNTVINICVNMSIINFILYFIATFTSGLAVGRMTTFFDIFNILLLPWLLKNLFTRQSYRVLACLCIALYIVYFYIQMVLTWGIVYQSDILHLYL